jgi:hypothetical protein
MTSRIGTLIGLLFVCVWASAVRADVVFPARLEMVESQAGLFDVQFDLPVQNQARVKATPVLPSVCVATGPQDVSFTKTAYRVVWQVKCPAEALPGQTVSVEGLLGSQTDVLLSIKTLKGRQYSALLKPAKAKFVIPQAPLMLPLTGT